MTTEHLQTASDWALIVACLSPSHRTVTIATEDAITARRLADGFGAGRFWGSPKEFTTDDWGDLFDWSHVRDSSDAAQKRIASFLRSLFS